MLAQGATEAMYGYFTSLSGQGKSSSTMKIDPMEFQIELNAEYARRNGGNGRASKVLNRLFC